jgi:hypothetical protein
MEYAIAFPGSILVTAHIGLPHIDLSFLFLLLSKLSDPALAASQRRCWRRAH